MTRLRKFLILGIGLLLVLAACRSMESDLTVESADDAEGNDEMATAVSTNTTQPIPPTTEPTNPPTAQPTAVPSPTPHLIRADFPNLGVAPEIENEVWLNTDEPVTLASQRGKVVLVEFWTFG